jgi:hypothetical protein
MMNGSEKIHSRSDSLPSQSREIEESRPDPGRFHMEEVPSSIDDSKRDVIDVQR